MFRCRTTDYVEPDMEWERERYALAGIDFAAFQLRGAPAEEILACAGDGHVLVVDQTRITAELLGRLDHTVLVIRHGDGYDSVDIDAATAAGIAVANKPGFWSAEAAEHAVTLTLAVASRLGHQQQEAAAGALRGHWDLHTVYPISRLRGRTVGVFGYGKIGHHYARMMHALGFHVIVHDRSCPEDHLTAAGYRSVSFQELLHHADILSLHVPATRQTVGLFDGAALRRMKRGSVLINTARGSLVHTDDLVAVLRAGHLSGAGLDVTEPEPLPAGHPLFSMPQVVITPHLGWYSEEAMWEMRRSIVEDVINAARRVPPASLVNHDVLENRDSRAARYFTS